MPREKRTEAPSDNAKTASARPCPTKRAPTRRKADKEPSVPERHNQELGIRGEKAAAQYLTRKGFEIRDRNWRCQAGEVDIVAEEEDALVFVEVKTRASCEHGFPEEAVDAKKRRRYELIASYYLKDHEVGDKAVRFDVVSILAVAPERAFLRHYRNAFEACE